MTYRVEVTPKVIRELKAIPEPIRRDIGRTIDTLAGNPRPQGVKRLKGVRNIFRIRVGDYRILYRIHDDVLIVYVVRIGNRAEVYRRLESL